MESGLVSSSHTFRAGNPPNQNRHLNQAPPALQQPAQHQMIVRVGMGKLKLGVHCMSPKRKEKSKNKTVCLLMQLRILTSCSSKIQQMPWSIFSERRMSKPGAMRRKWCRCKCRCCKWWMGQIHLLLHLHPFISGRTTKEDSTSNHRSSPGEWVDPVWIHKLKMLCSL